MKVDSKEISNYIKSIIEGIDDGLPKGYFVSSGITIDLGLRNVTNKKGELKVLVAGAGGEHAKEENARVTFQVTNPLSLAVKAEASKQAEEMVEGGDMSEQLGLTTITHAEENKLADS